MTRIGVDRTLVRVAAVAALTAFAAASMHAQSFSIRKGSPSESSGRTVVQTPIEHIVISAEPGTLFTGVTISHSARGVCKDGTERRLSPVWRSSDPAIATVDSAGKVTARKAGIVTISAEADGVRGTKTYAITRRPAEKLLIDLPNKPFRSGETI